MHERKTDVVCRNLEIYTQKVWEDKTPMTFGGLLPQDSCCVFDPDTAISTDHILSVDALRASWSQVLDAVVFLGSRIGITKKGVLVCVLRRTDFRPSAFRFAPSSQRGEA